MAALFCAAKLSLSGSASSKLEMLFPLTPCVSARVNCSVRVRHMSPIECQPCAFVCQFQPLPLRCELTHATSRSLRSRPLCVCRILRRLALAAGAGVSASGLAAPHPSFLFSYHCSTAALSGKQPLHRPLLRGSRGRWHRSARPTLWKRPAPALCDTWHPVGLCGSGRSSSFLPGPSAQRSAADRRHLVCACAAGLPASAALTPNNRPQLQTSGFLLLLLAVTGPTLA